MLFPSVSTSFLIHCHRVSMMSMRNNFRQGANFDLPCPSAEVIFRRNVDVNSDVLGNESSSAVRRLYSNRQCHGPSGAPTQRVATLNHERFKAQEKMSRATSGSASVISCHSCVSRRLPRTQMLNTRWRKSQKLLHFLYSWPTSRS